MSISITVHSVTGAEAKQHHGHSWLELDSNGEKVAAFMPYAQAKAMADAFNAASVEGRNND